MGRAYDCGNKTGEAIIEMAHLFYQLDTKRRFFRGLLDVILPEADKVVVKYNRKDKRQSS